MERKRKNGARKSSRGYIAMLVICGLIAALVALNGGLFYRMVNDQSESLCRERVQIISGELDSELKNAEILIRQAAADMELIRSGGGGITAYEEYIAGKKESIGDESCINVFAAGEDWVYAPGFTEPEGFSYADRVWYKGAVKKGVGKVYISAPYQDAATGDMCFTVSALLSDRETVVGIDYDLTRLQESVSEIGSRTGGDALIVTAAGQIVGYSDEEYIGRQLNEALPMYNSVFGHIISAGGDSITFSARISGKTSTVFCSRTENNWYLISTVTNSVLYRDIYRRVISNTVLGAVIIIAVILLYVMTIRSRRRVEEALDVKERFLSGMSSELRNPMRTIIHYSDYNELMSSGDPKAYMSRIRESAAELDHTLSNMLSYSGLERLEEKERTDTSPEELEKKINTFSNGQNRIVMTAIIAILIAAMSLAVFISSRTLLTSGNIKMQSDVNGYLSEFGLWMTDQKSTLDMFVRFLSVDSTVLDDYDGAVEWLEGIVSQDDSISAAYIVNPDRENWFIMDNGFIPDGDYDPAQKQWYADAIASEEPDGFAFTGPYYDTRTGLYCVTMSERVYDEEGAFIGVFAIDYYLDKLTDILTPSYKADGYAFLVDTAGNIVNHPNPEYQLDPTRAVSLEQAGYSGILYSGHATFIHDYDNTLRAAYSVTEPVSGFRLIGVENWDKAYGNLLGYDILLIIIFALCIAVIFYLVSRQMKWQTEVNDMLKASAEEAERADKAKSQFLAQMSHEIRTPINAILGMNEMIMRESPDKEILEYTSNIQNAGNTLLYLINSILDFSKIENGKMEIVPVNYDTASMINDLVNMVQDRAVKKGLHFHVAVDPDIPKTMNGDDVRLRQVVTNLLTNAVKYTEKGDVWFRVSSFDRKEDCVTVRIEVEDTGMGIKEEDMDRLFATFQRLELDKNRNVEGTGLGMSIVQKLLEMMGSTLRGESEYGKGSVFSFDIVQGIVDEQGIGDYTKRLEESRKTQSGARYVYAPDARVLVIDDNNMNLMVTRGLLKRSGMRVDTAGSGRDGIALAGVNTYDIIFVDHMMPGMDGMETLRALREKKLVPEGTSVVMMTANAVVGAREEYLKAGFDDYISKPIEVKKMEKLLAAYIPKEKLSYKVQEGTAAEGISEDSGESADAPARNAPADRVKRMTFIDTGAGLASCMNNEVYYIYMLQAYVRADHRAELEDLLMNGDMTGYISLLRLMSAESLCIGALKISDMCMGLIKILNEDEGADIRDEHYELLKNYREVITSLSSAIMP